MDVRKIDLFVAISAVLATAILVSVDITIIRFTAALLLVFVLPGYAIVRALFVYHKLANAELLALTIGVSCITSVIGAFILNVTPWAITRNSWAIMLCVLTVGVCGVAWWRRRNHAMLVTSETRYKTRFYIRDYALIGGAALIVVGSIASAYMSQTQQDRNTRFTQLWMLPSNTAQNSIRVGIRNEEQTPMRYLLRLELDGATIADWPPIEVAQSDDWQAVVDLPQTQFGPGRIEAKLYRVDQPTEVYRLVRLWNWQGR